MNADSLSDSDIVIICRSYKSIHEAVGVMDRSLPKRIVVRPEIQAIREALRSIRQKLPVIDATMRKAGY